MKTEKMKCANLLLVLLPLLFFFSCGNMKKTNEELRMKLTETQGEVSELTDTLAQRRKEIVGILRELEEVSGSILIVRNDLERRKKSNVQQINNQIATIKQRLKQAEKNYGKDADIIQLQEMLANRQKEIMVLVEKIKNLEGEITILKDDNEQKEKTIEEQLRVIKEQLKTIKEERDAKEASQRDTWFQAGQELFQLYKEYQDVTTGGLIRDKNRKDKINEKQMNENKRKLLERAKACFQEAAQLKHTGANAQIRQIDLILYRFANQY